MASWNAARTPVPPPGPIDPPPTLATPGWSEWVQRQADAATARDLPGNAPRLYQVTLSVVRGAIERWPVSGDAPGPWEKTMTARTPAGQPHRDWTRFSRRYPRLIWQEIQWVLVTVVVDYFGAAPPAVHRANFQAVLRGPILEAGRTVHVWLETSGERATDGGTLIWEDLVLRPADDPVPTPTHLGTSPEDLPVLRRSGILDEIDPPKDTGDGWGFGPGVEWRMKPWGLGLGLGDLYRGKWTRERELRETVERHAREDAATGRETDDAGDAAEETAAGRQKKRRRRRKGR